MQNESYSIYTDVSFDQSSGNGVAGVMFIEEDRGFFTPDSAPAVDTKYFRNTNCTRLEIEAIIWAFDTIKKLKLKSKVKIYTDCKTAVDLPKRRKRLEEMNFKSKTTGLPLNNGDLYVRFFALFDELNPQIILIKGHKPKKQQNLSEQLFAIVDKATRKALRVTRFQNLLPH